MKILSILVLAPFVFFGILIAILVAIVLGFMIMVAITSEPEETATLISRAILQVV